MKKAHIMISHKNKIKLNSYHPLCSTVIGVRAVDNFGFKPFIDGSCRREPDFEHEYPSISALCRKGQFAPHIKVGDVVVYMTVAGKLPPYKNGYHLVAILQAVKVYPTHRDGEIGYLSDGLPVPSNCMSSNQGLYQFHETLGNYKNNKERKRYLTLPCSTQLNIGMKKVKAWNNTYLKISNTWPCFVRTKKIYANLIDPPIITEIDFNRIFRKVPLTRNPNLISRKVLNELGKLVDLEITLDSE